MAALNVSPALGALLDNMLSSSDSTGTMEDAFFEGVGGGYVLEKMLDAGLVPLQELRDQIKFPFLLAVAAYLAAADTAPTQEAVSFTNSWVNFGGALETAGYYRTNGRVHLKGTVSSGVVGSAMFTLAEGYRPAATCRFAVPSNGAFGIVEIAADGTVTLISGNNIYASLDGISFPIA